MKKFFRPEWTCGRYDSEHRVAIFYNLIEGLVYLFEDESAHVVSIILQNKRNDILDITKICNETGISEEIIIEFLKELSSRGLITDSIPTDDFINDYRKNLIEYRKRFVKQSVAELQKTELLNSHDEVEMQYMSKCGSIFNLMIELTYNCSEKCIHCYNVGASRNDSEKEYRNISEPLTFEEYKRVINEFCELGLVKVCLTGGDPFSNPLIWEIIDYCWQNELAIDIFTNGQLLEGKVERLAKYYPRTVGISVYSGLEKVHDSITRVKGSFKRTLKCIKECSDLAIPMVLKCCIMQPNVKSYYTVKDIAYQYGMIPQFDLNITDSLDGDICASKYLRLNHEQMSIVLRDYDLPYYIDSVGTKKETIIIGENKLCNAGINTFCLTPSGEIQPCCAFPMKCGNIKRQSAKEILRNQSLNKWRKHSLRDCQECHKQPYCKYCQMCAGNNFNSTGDYLKASENNCFLAKERYSLFQSLSNGIDPLNSDELEKRLDKLEVKIPTLKREIKRINGVSL